MQRKNKLTAYEFRKKYTKKPLLRKVATPLKRTRTPIKKISDKRSKLLKKYLEIRVVFLSHNTVCAAKLQDCTHRATQIHHMQGREGKLLIDEKNFLAICSSCHRRITDHSKEAIKTGLSVSRHKKINNR